jgi:hypothetical protein
LLKLKKKSKVLFKNGWIPIGQTTNYQKEGYNPTNK